MNPAQQCAELIREAKSIAVLTGAGISTSAGIPDFRGPEGLYVTKKYDADKVFDIHYFLNDPKPFFEFARDFVGLEKDIKPTIAHRFLAELEGSGKLSGVITQNIDSLHQKAGSRKVFEMHGSFWKSHCWSCCKTFSYQDMQSKIFTEDVPRCFCGGVIKPDVVFFGENVKYLEEASKLAEESDLFFVIGTSCVVYPAATIPTLARGKTVVVNKDPIGIPLSNNVLSVRDHIDDFFSAVGECLDEINGLAKPA